MGHQKIPYYYLLYIIVVLTVWLGYMQYSSGWILLSQNMHAMITMIFGSFVAGSSPEGSASIAYPVFTLYLNIQPDDARNFAFAIQSIGMTSASVYILNKGLKLDWNYIKFVSLSGIFGLVAGTYWLVPFVQPLYAKLIFVSLWLSFGIILFIQNKKSHNNVYESILQFTHMDIVYLLIFGFIGGLISAIFGTGINIFTFCFLVIYYKVNEKVATPSSILIMTIETIIGFALHGLVLGDISRLSYEMWLSCIPIVIFFAPLGTYFMSKLSRSGFNNFLYLIFFLQYIGAMYVIRPDAYKIFLSLSIIVAGMLLFFYLSTRKRIKGDY